MTKEIEQEIEEAREIFENINENDRIKGNYFEAKGKLRGYELGLKQGRKEVEELLEGYEIIIKQGCCPEKSFHGNTCPRWIAEEALAKYRKEK